MQFRLRLLATLRAVQPVLDVPGVLVVGSEVPNLLEPDAAATLVVSQDVDLAVPVERHALVKERLRAVTGLVPSREEPSVWLPDSPDLLEVNFLGVDAELTDPTALYVLEDAELPLLVFGALSLLRPAPPRVVARQSVPLPRPAGLLLEKLLTERSGPKGARDLLVALGVLLVAAEADLDEAEQQYAALAPEHRHAVRSNLTVLSLCERIDGMPEAAPHRARIAALLRRLEATTAETQQP